MRFVWVALLVVTGSAVGQDAKKEYDLTWKLPYDRAAIYDVWDVAKKSKRSEFWLLGCELEGRVGALDESDLPYRFLFRLPKKKLKVGDTWEVKELAFGTAPEERINTILGFGCIGPNALQVLGTYRLKEAKTLRIEEFLKAVPRDRRERSEPVQALIVEGVFNLHRARKQSGTWVLAEQKPSSTLSTTVLVRAEDGAILGGRFTLRGRIETYKDMIGTAVIITEEAVELLLHPNLLSLDRHGLKERIDRAVAVGMTWLKSQQAKDGRFTEASADIAGSVNSCGPTALCLLALLHSGMSPDDPTIRAGFEHILRYEFKQSYDVSLLLMALEAKYLPMGMLEDIDSFSEDRAIEAISKRITDSDKRLAQRAAQWLMQVQSSSGAFGYTDPHTLPNLSNTQYALLGLKSASRMGVSIPASVWKRTLEYVESNHVLTSTTTIRMRIKRWGEKELEQECKLVGWRYTPQDVPQVTGSITTAALVCIAICRSELTRSNDWQPELGTRITPLEWGGLSWLHENYSVRAGPPEAAYSLASWPYFYLYSLERAAVLLRVERLGDHDWFWDGAAAILSWQETGGQWKSRFQLSVLDTSLALLFLKRAVLPVATIDGGNRK